MREVIHSCDSSRLSDAGLGRRLGDRPFAHPADHLSIEPGSPCDYRALSEHHYRAARPATMTRVIRMVDRTPSAVDRWLDRTVEPRVAAVLVESLPALNCRLRDWALHERFAHLRQARVRSIALNQELRCISRVVVHPQWRGLGLAVRLVRHALRSATTRYTEALAAMGKVHPFFERAGMTRYERPPHDYDLRLIDALRCVGIAPIDLAMLDQVLRRIDQLAETRRQWVKLELRRWYRRTFGRSSHFSDDPKVHLKAARLRVLSEPVYFLHDNASDPRKA